MALGRKAREFREAVEEELAKQGAYSLSWEITGTGHQRCLFLVAGGLKGILICPHSASDHRAIANGRCSVRKAVRQAK